MGSFAIVKSPESTTPHDLSRFLPVGEPIIISTANLKKRDKPLQSLELLAREHDVKIVVREGDIHIKTGHHKEYPCPIGYGTLLSPGDKVKIPGFGTYVVEYKTD